MEKRRDKEVETEDITKKRRLNSILNQGLTEEELYGLKKLSEAEEYQTIKSAIVTFNSRLFRIECILGIIF